MKISQFFHVGHFPAGRLRARHLDFGAADQIDGHRQKGLSNPQVPGWLKMGKSNELSSEDGFRISPALALGFILGLFWQIRRDELDRRRFKNVARIPRLQSPT